MYTGCKLIIVDPERASIVESITSRLKEEMGVTGFLVLDRCNRSWEHMESLSKLVDAYPRYNDFNDILSQSINPEDNATIIFTSGIRFPVFRLIASHYFDRRDNGPSKRCPQYSTAVFD